MRNARAFVFPAPEDFGLVMAEAQACGTPVIALGAGGALEIVRGPDTAAPTGLFFGQQTVDALASAVRLFESSAERFTPAACRHNALRFDAQRFRSGLTAAVSRLAQAHDPRRA